MSGLRKLASSTNVVLPANLLNAPNNAYHTPGSKTTFTASTRSGFCIRPNAVTRSLLPQNNFFTWHNGALCSAFMHNKSKTKCSPSVAVTFAPNRDATMEGKPNPAPSSIPCLPFQLPQYVQPAPTKSLPRQFVSSRRVGTRSLPPRTMPRTATYLT